MSEREQREDAPKCWINVKAERSKGRQRWIVTSRAHGQEQGYAVAYTEREAQTYASSMAARLVTLAQPPDRAPGDDPDPAFDDRRSTRRVER
jgi:hypothetical protein